MLNTILFRLIQQQKILGNTLLWGLAPTARRKFVFRKSNQK